MTRSAHFFVLICFLEFVAMQSLCSAADSGDESRLFFQAKATYDDGILQESTDQLKAILEQFPQSRYKIEIYCLLGQAALSRAEHERAAMYFHRILLAPENPFQEKARFLLTQCYFGEGKDEQVWENAQQLLKDYPLSGFAGVARLTMGKSMVRLGKTQDAMVAFEKIISSNSGTETAAWAAVEQAKILSAQKKYTAACTRLTSLAQVGNPMKPGVLELWLGDLFSRAGDAKQALTWYSPTIPLSAVPARDIAQKLLLGKARCLAQTGDAAGAVAAYEAFAVAYPASRWMGLAQSEMARLKLKDGNTDAAQSILTGAPWRRMSRVWQEKAAFLRSQLALQKKEYRVALTRLGYFLATFPQSGNADNARYQIAWALFSQGKYEEALGAAQQCAQTRMSIVLQGDALSRLSRWDESILLYGSALEKFPKAQNDDVLQRLGNSFTQAKRWSEAKNSLEQLIEHYPQSVWGEASHYHLGLLQVQDGEFNKAAETFQLLVEKFPAGDSVPSALYEQGNCWYRLDQTEKALRAYQQVMEKFPKSSLKDKALAQTGWSLARAGKDKEAAEIFATCPLAPEILFWMGQERMAQNDLVAAQGFFQKVAEMPSCPQSKDALLCWAIALARAGRQDESSGIARRLLALDPDVETRTDANFLVADNEAALKHYARAISIWESIVTVNPQGIRVGAAHLRIGDCYYARGDYAKALAEFGAWTQAADTMVAAQARFKKAAILETMGEMEQAKEILLGLHFTHGIPAPWPGKAALLLGQIFEREDRPGEALRLYEKVAAQAGEDSELARQRTERIRSLQLYERKNI